MNLPSMKPTAPARNTGGHASTRPWGAADFEPDGADGLAYFRPIYPMATPLLPAAATGRPAAAGPAPTDFVPFMAAAAMPAASAATKATAPQAVATAATVATTTVVAPPSWISQLSTTSIRADMIAADVGGTVSFAGMEKLFTDVQVNLASGKTTLSASQYYDLRTISANIGCGESCSPYLASITNSLVNKSAFNATWTGGNTTSVTMGNLGIGSSATQLDELIGTWFRGTNLPSSFAYLPVIGQVFSVSYAPEAAPLYAAGGPSVSDVNQGDLGDCYLLAGLAEVADQNPSLIRSMITDNGDNTYGVRFYIKGTPTYVTVNNAMADGGTIFNTGPGMWASLVEKAYAQLQAGGTVVNNLNLWNLGDSWSSIGNGGVPMYALEEITGSPTMSFIQFLNTGWYFNTSNQSFLGAQATLMTPEAGLDTLIARLAKGDDAVLTSFTNATDLSGKRTLIANHAMAITGYDAATGDLIIRNPWGTAPGQDWETTFEVSIAALRAAGDVICLDSMGQGPTLAAPVVSKQTPTQSWQAGKAVSFALPAGTFTDPQGLALRYSATLSNGAALPSWLSFDSATQTFSGTEPGGTTDFGITVTATDSMGLATSETFSVVATPAPAPAPVVPVATKAPVARYWIPTLNAFEGMKFTYTVDSALFVDPQGAALTYSAKYLPSWLSYDATTRTLSGTAPTTAGTSYGFVYATDSYGLSACECFAINVGTTAAAPTRTYFSGNLIIAGNIAFSDPLDAATFTDPQGATLTYSATTTAGGALPSWLKFNSADGTFSGTAPTTAGTSFIKVTATDSYGLSASESLSVATVAAKPGATLTGGTVADIYVVGRGSNADIIDNRNHGADGDKVLFGNNVAIDQLWFQQAGNDLKVSIIGTSDSATILGWYQSTANHVSQFQTADHHTLADPQVQNLVAAMASMAPPPMGSTMLTAAQANQLEPVIAANWQTH